MKRVSLISAALLCAVLAAPASAEPTLLTLPSVVEPLAAKDVRAWQVAQRKISPQEARTIALRRVPGGEVVEIFTFADFYRIRIIDRRTGTAKRVDIDVDAYTGRIR